jgi:hypothetical protein
MSRSTPPRFDEEFLRWFREATERAWARPDLSTVEDHLADGSSGRDFRPGTRWTCDLSDAEIDALERSWDLRFPPDHRLLLRTLHATHPPQWGVGYGEDNELVPYTCAGFYHWITEADEIRAALDRVFDGLLFDVEENGLWRDSWGRRPRPADERRACLRAAFAAAPRLVPVYGHRMLLAEPQRAGNPVLSIHQSDIVIYGHDLRTYLLSEFADDLGLADDDAASDLDDRMDIAAIPFWGELIG